jgi:hypothetical protein
MPQVERSEGFRRCVLALPVLLAACTIVRTQDHPTVQDAPTHEATDTSRLSTVAQVAAKDLSCPQVEVVLTFNRDYANVAQPSHVVDGCGRRAVYAETCSNYPRCTFLLLSIVAIPGAQAPVSGGPVEQ